MKILLALLLSISLNAFATVGQKAPDFDVATWINGDGVSIEDLRGKVVIVDFFQLWCPGCNTFTIPLMHKWEKKYQQQIKEGKLEILSIHTVFEGHSIQTLTALKAFLKIRGIDHLVGNDRLIKGERLPETMKKYNTRGTPEVAIIDKNGIIRFQRFGGFNVVSAENLIERLLETFTQI
ncbi:MAG: Thiol-disulfide oxidoreductase ResA [Catillopecten margaritatus gill symbiont]|uniref:Thiol-disulfide oxidoreductase ResA n=1 Tax=Catillopecten margaritatus gill symbiont TaxID=3083288 RepID=A0AAU6PH36_9GAMM